MSVYIDSEIAGANYIAGNPSKQGDDLFTGINPATKEAGSIQFSDATPDEINSAVQEAAAAFAMTRAYSASQFVQLLRYMSSEIEQAESSLVNSANFETGLGGGRLKSELKRTTGQLQKFADLLTEGSYVEAIIDTYDPGRLPTPRPSIRRMLFPIGPVAVFTASNFPFAFSVAGGDTASAMAAGCPVIVKAHPGHPATSELTAQAIYRAIEKASFPMGFFSLLQGNGIDVGQQIVRHPDIEAVAFTGSLRGGRAIYDSAAARPKPIPVYAEMGSINPVFILPEEIKEHQDELAKGLTKSVTLGSGQFCTNPGIVFVVSGSETEDFIQRVISEMQSAVPNLLLNESILTGLDKALTATLSTNGVKALIGAEPLEGTGFCFQHTVLQTTADAFLSDEVMQTEHFGPVTMFVLCDSFEQMLVCAQALHGNLTATVHSSNSEQHLARRLFDLLKFKVGRLIFNGFPTGVEVVHSMMHGGPYPATTAPWSTSVGMTAYKRFMVPVAMQGLPDELLPLALQDSNPLNIWRTVDGALSTEPILR